MARRFAVEAAVLPLLRAMHAEAGGVGCAAELPSERDLARGLRRWLKKAGVDRSELHAGSRTRKAMTFHDTRATGLTWLAVRGDDPLKIMQRAGHTDFKTTQGYIRTAEAVRQGFGDVFPPLQLGEAEPNVHAGFDVAHAGGRLELPGVVVVRRLVRRGVHERLALVLHPVEVAVHAVGSALLGLVDDALPGIQEVAPSPAHEISDALLGLFVVPVAVVPRPLGARWGRVGRRGGSAPK